MPLPHTVDDFWCLVWDHAVSSIVMLNEDGRNGNDPSIGKIVLSYTVYKKIMIDQR